MSTSDNVSQNIHNKMNSQPVGSSMSDRPACVSHPGPSQGSLDILISKITIPTNCTLEILAGQLQAFTETYLYVVDDLTLHVYRSLDEVPPGNRQLEPATFPGYGPGFYIRDLNTQQLICCFKEDLCKRFLGFHDLGKKEKPWQIRIIKEPEEPEPEKANSAPTDSSLKNRLINVPKVVAPGSHKDRRTEKDNQKGKCIDMSQSIVIAPPVKTTRYI
jgi:hypothetical protein